MSDAGIFLNILSLALLWRVLVMQGELMTVADLIAANTARIKNALAKVAADVRSLQGRIGTGGLTEEEATVLANDLGGIADQLESLDAETPDEPATELPPPTEPPSAPETENPPTDGQ